MPLIPGDLLANKYRIEAEIGRGAYGRVYRARDSKLDRPVAVKELARGVGDGQSGLGSSLFADYVRRFEREARVQAGFNHPNIVHVYELIQESADRLYLVMEYVDGESLRDSLARRGPLPIDEAVRITGDILAGLAAVHADPRDIVHRDIKPSNVLLTRAGQAKLADFGLAQVGDDSLRSEGGKPHPGTALYMSPEQETTSAYLYPASDLFSVGCVLFEMLTGVSYKRAKKERKGLAELRPDTPQWLSEIVAAALAKDPDDRPANAVEMGQLLAEAKAKVEAEVKAKAEAEERARQEARRKAEEEAQRTRLAEQERQRRAAEEQAQLIASLQAQSETMRRASEDAQRRQQAEEAERTRQEASRVAQAEAEAARLAKQQQERRQAAEQAQQEVETRAAARRRLLPWMVGVVVVLALVLAVWRPWTGGARSEPTRTTALVTVRDATPPSQPTRAREPTKIPATAVTLSEKAPTETPAPTTKPPVTAVLQSAETPATGLVLYDDFNNTAFDGSYNHTLWEYQGENSYQARQQGGALAFSNTASPSESGGELVMLQPPRRTLRQLRQFEARLKISRDHTGRYAFVKISVRADVSGHGWWTQCRLGARFSSTQPDFVCDVSTYNNDGSIQFEYTSPSVAAAYDTWYVVRMEADPLTAHLRFYFDGKLIDSYAPKDAAALIIVDNLTPKVGVWNDDANTAATRYVDDVWITSVQ